VAHYEAEPAVEGWDIKRRVTNQAW
jgi:hypothetical protein